MVTPAFSKVEGMCGNGTKCLGVLLLAVPLLLVASSALTEEPASLEASPLTYVDPLVAAKDRDANGFPGPKMPFGVVTLSPDCVNPESGRVDTNSGYSTGRIRGFSHLHVSGTGGGPKYGVILLSPVIGSRDDQKIGERTRDERLIELNDILRDYGSTQRVDEKAWPGYYCVRLKDYGIGVELTVTERVGFHRYTFPQTDSAYVLLDVFHHLERALEYGEGQLFVRGDLELDPTKRKIKGSGTYQGGWNKGDEYTVFFCAVFDTSWTDFGIWRGKLKRPGQLVYPGLKRATAGMQQRFGAYTGFRTHAGQQIQVKLGISFVSSARAEKNVQAEAPHWEFDHTRRCTQDVWREYLTRITLDLQGLPAAAKKEFFDRELTHFYSALYRCHLMPSDRTKEDPKAPHSTAPYYDDFYCLWDTYRTLHPLLTLTAPKRQTEIVEALINIHERDGYMPDGRSGNSNGRTQGGSNADIVLADAFVKGLATKKGTRIDWSRALKAMLKNAEEEPRDAEKEGRGGVRAYNELGYVPMQYPRSGTRTVEYSTCDFAIAQVAKGLATRGGKDSRKYERLAAKYLRRSCNWRNLWLENGVYRDGGSGNEFFGFIWAKSSDGSWLQPFDSRVAGSWSDVFYEDNSWSYSFSIPHDIRGVIEKCGGEERFRRRLDFFFAQVPEEDTNYGNAWFRIGNEPDFFTPFCYAWVGRPGKSGEIVRRTIIQEFHEQNTPTLPGNDDAGALSSWYIFASMGIYPVAGTDVYLLTPPLFPKVTVSREDGPFSIVVENPHLLWPLGNVYIESAALIRGETKSDVKRPWLRHEEICGGNVLSIKLSKSPTSWGQDPGLAPPSGENLLYSNRYVTTRSPGLSTEQ